VSTNRDSGRLILVVEDVEETRDGIEKLLKADGYRVEPARTVQEAIVRAKRERPDLLLVCLAGPSERVIQLAIQIRQEAELNEEVPIVVFCIEEVPPGEEVAIKHKVYLTQPDNFNQLRAFLHRLLNKQAV
jgi:CheY-like chemotaxis protein